MFNNFFFRKSCRLWDNVEKYCTVRQGTDDNMAHARCILDTWGYRHTFRICNTFAFHRNSGCTNAPQCNVIRTLAVRWTVCNTDFPNKLTEFLDRQCWRAISVPLEHLLTVFLDIARGTYRADVWYNYERIVATLLQGLGSYPRVSKRLLCTGSPILLLHRYRSLLSGGLLQQVSDMLPLVRMPERRSA